jgi:hypothetical protein
MITSQSPASKCHGSYLVDCVGLDSKRKATHIETLDQS